MFRKAVILADSKAAIPAITSSVTPENEIIKECQRLLKHLDIQDKLIVFQWISLHIEISSIEKVDELAKKGNRKEITAHSKS